MCMAYVVVLEIDAYNCLALVCFKCRRERIDKLLSDRGTFAYLTADNFACTFPHDLLPATLRL